jgi:hypothetical protein
VEINNGGAEGVLFALGGDAAGFSLFLWEGKPRFHYNFFGLRRYDANCDRCGCCPSVPGRRRAAFGLGSAGSPCA